VDFGAFHVQDWVILKRDPRSGSSNQVESLRRPALRVDEKVKGFVPIRHTGGKMLKTILLCLSGIIVSAQTTTDTENAVPIATQ